MKANVKELAIALLTLAFLSSCANQSASTPSQQSQKAIGVSNTAKTETTIKIDGSSTVYPITQAIAKEFQADSNHKADVEVKFSGTTAGLKNSVLEKQTSTMHLDQFCFQRWKLARKMG